MNCRYCKQPLGDDQVATFSYWNAVKFWCHAACKKLGEAQEAWDCQEVDQSCNWCKHLQRTGPRAGRCGVTTELLSFHPQDFGGRQCFEARRVRP